MKHLFLDDERKPLDVTWPVVWIDFERQTTTRGDMLPRDWQIVRNYDQFVAWIENNGIPSIVTFDHDLADEHYQALRDQRNRHVSTYESFRERTGYECCKYLVDRCMRDGVFPDIVGIHTMNPVGRDKMVSLWLTGYRHQ